MRRTPSRDGATERAPGSGPIALVTRCGAGLAHHRFALAEASEAPPVSGFVSTYSRRGLAAGGRDIEHSHGLFAGTNDVVNQVIRLITIGVPDLIRARSFCEGSVGMMQSRRTTKSVSLRRTD